MSRRRTSQQQQFRFRTWGGKRRRTGRKPKGLRAGVPHVARPLHVDRHPVHITLRARRQLPSLRKQSVFLAVRGALSQASRAAFRIVHFSVQVDHVHLLVEADDKLRLSRGMSGLAIRVARAVNGLLHRHGAVWADRYHAHVLRTPREVRHGLVYVLMNLCKHAPARADLDPCSSVFWFRGWNEDVELEEPPGWTAGDGPPVAAAETWLLTAGWRRLGLIDPREQPASRPA